MDGSPSKNTVLAWARLMRASGQALKAIETDFKASRHPPLAWYDVLLELKQAEGGLRPFELQGRLLLEQHNVSRLLDRMEAKGLVERQQCVRDARGQVIVITADGRALQKKMWPTYRIAIQRHIGEKLSAPDAAKLAALLQKLL
jgi:DNA-binding MarR family transcriptional regulator